MIFDTTPARNIYSRVQAIKHLSHSSEYAPGIRAALGDILRELADLDRVAHDAALEPRRRQRPYLSLTVGAR